MKKDLPLVLRDNEEEWGLYGVFRHLKVFQKCLPGVLNYGSSLRATVFCSRSFSLFSRCGINSSGLASLPTKHDRYSAHKLYSTINSQKTFFKLVIFSPNGQKIPSSLAVIFLLHASGQTPTNLII